MTLPILCAKMSVMEMLLNKDWLHRVSSLSPNMPADALRMDGAGVRMLEVEYNRFGPLKGWVRVRNTSVVVVVGPSFSNAG